MRATKMPRRKTQAKAIEVSFSQRPQKTSLRHLTWVKSGVFATTAIMALSAAIAPAAAIVPAPVAPDVAIEAAAAIVPATAGEVRDDAEPGFAAAGNGDLGSWYPYVSVKSTGDVDNPKLGDELSMQFTYNTSLPEGYTAKAFWDARTTVSDYNYILNKYFSDTLIIDERMQGATIIGHVAVYGPSGNQVTAVRGTHDLIVPLPPFNAELISVAIGGDPVGGGYATAEISGIHPNAIVGDISWYLDGNQLLRESGVPLHDIYFQVPREWAGSELELRVEVLGWPEVHVLTDAVSIPELLELEGEISVDPITFDKNNFAHFTLFSNFPESAAQNWGADFEWFLLGEDGRSLGMAPWVTPENNHLASEAYGRHIYNDWAGRDFKVVVVVSANVPGFERLRTFETVVTAPSLRGVAGQVNLTGVEPGSTARAEFTFDREFPESADFYVNIAWYVDGVYQYASNYGQYWSEIFVQDEWAGKEIQAKVTGRLYADGWQLENQFSAQATVPNSPVRVTLIDSGDVQSGVYSRVFLRLKGQFIENPTDYQINWYLDGDLVDTTNPGSAVFYWRVPDNAAGKILTAALVDDDEEVSFDSAFVNGPFRVSHSGGNANAPRVGDTVYSAEPIGWEIPSRFNLVPQRMWITCPKTPTTNQTNYNLLWVQDWEIEDKYLGCSLTLTGIIKDSLGIISNAQWQTQAGTIADRTVEPDWSIVGIFGLRYDAGEPVLKAAPVAGHYVTTNVRRPSEIGYTYLLTYVFRGSEYLHSIGQLPWDSAGETLEVRVSLMAYNADGPDTILGTKSFTSTILEATGDWATGGNDGGTDGPVVIPVAPDAVLGLGVNGVWDGKSEVSARFSIPYRGAEFVSVMFEGTALTYLEDYTLTEGSTIVTLTDSFLAALEPGAHEFTVQFDLSGLPEFEVDSTNISFSVIVPDGGDGGSQLVPSRDFGVWARHGSAVAQIPAPYAEFAQLKLNGVAVPVTVLPAPGAPADTGTYGVTATELPDGSTQLSLHHNYLKVLEREVPHKFKAVFSNGPAVTLTLTPGAGFVDVPHTSNFHEHMHWMLDSNLAAGWDMGNGVREYRPGNVMLRNSMAAFLFRISGETETFVAPTVATFADVPVGASFYREIEWMAARGISTGWEINENGVVRREFRPGQPLTREAAAAFLYRLAGADHTFTGTMFADITGSSEQRRGIETAVEWMAAKGISTGTPSQTGGLPTFNPGGGLKRDSMAAFIYRAVNEAKVISIGG